MLVETLVHLLRDNYTEAKIRGKKSYLLSRAQLYSLAELGSLGEILGFLADGPYGPELSKLQESSSPVEVEKAVRLGFARTVRNIASSAKGNIEEFIDEFLRRFEAHDLATLLIYRAQARPWEEFVAARESVSRTSDSQFRRFYSTDDLGRVVGLVGDEALRSRMNEVSLESLTPDKASLVRDILNGWGEERFYDYVNGKVHGRDRSSCLPIVGASIDLLNISVVLRTKLIGIKNVLAHLVPIYWRLDKRILERFSAAEDVSLTFEQAAAVGQYRSVLQGARQKYEESKSLGYLEISVRKYLIDASRKVLLKFPNSLGVVLGFLMLKENEARNIAALVSGVGAGLRGEMIRPLLVA